VIAAFPDSLPWRGGAQPILKRCSFCDIECNILCPFALAGPYECVTADAHLQVLRPEALISREMLATVHASSYTEAFLAGRLDAAMQRRIGLVNVLASQVLINRTLWEASGAATPTRRWHD
jgi:hypothetical protein